MKNIKSIDEFVNEAAKLEGLVAYVLSIGIINIPTGKTQYGWSIYEYPKSRVYFMEGYGGGFLLCASPDTFKDGDVVTLVDNDIHRKVGTFKVADSCECEQHKIIDWLYTKHQMDYKPKRAFQKSAFQGRNSKLGTSYYVKGT